VTLGIVGSLAVVLAGAALRELALASPRALRWLVQAVDPLLRAGREGHIPTTLERRKLAILGTASLMASGWLVAGWRLALVLGIAGAAVAAWAVARRRDRYRRAAASGLPSLSRAIADGLAGGRSLRGALAPAAASVEGAIAAEIAQVVAELELGASTSSAIEGLRRRLKSSAADAFAATLLSPRLGGGDMALLLRRYAEATAERTRLLEDTRAATAQARFTGVLVVAMPTGAAVFGELVDPGFISSLVSSSAALALLAAAVAMQAVGFVAIRRLSAILE
jgi:tight adherence protein B